MSFTDRLVLWLHIAFAIFTLGPVTLAISSTPRYIRRRELGVLRYLSRITVIFTIGSLPVLIFGIVLGQLLHDFAHPWLTAAMTLFVVSLVLLVLIIRDQRRAIKALSPVGAAAGGGGVSATGGASAGSGGVSAAGAPGPADQPGPGSPADPLAGQPPGVGAAGPPGSTPGAGGAGLTGAGVGVSPVAVHTASVERGRIAGMGGVVNLIWLAILVLMVWKP